MENIKKRLQKVFKNNGLDVIIGCNMKIPKTIGKRLSQLSPNEEIFNESTPFYENKLYQSGYHQKLKYNHVSTKLHNNCNHKRNIISFNLSFSRNVSTKIGTNIF